MPPSQDDDKPRNEGSERYLRAREIHIRAAELPEEERSEYLDKECGDDSGLRREVDTLLRASSESFLASAADPRRTVTVDAPLEPGEPVRYFGDYEIIEEIARGAMGVVYRARQTSLNREVAVKMILAGQLATDDAVHRFQREAEAAAGLKHPNIVTIHEVGEHYGLHYFSMDYVEGDSLATRLERGPLSPMLAAEYAHTVARAVQAAHDAGTLHRDLKPANLLIDKSGAIHITDFGLSKVVATESTDQPASGATGEVTQVGTIVGTPAYMAPEQARGDIDGIGPHTDIYAVGATLYHMLAGHPPFQGESLEGLLAKVQEGGATSIDEVDPRIPQNLAVICMKCLRPKPEDRYATAGELAADLERFMNHEPLATEHSASLLNVLRWARRHPMRFGNVVGVVCFALVATIYGQYSYSSWLAAGSPAPSSEIGADGSRAMSVFYAAMVSLTATMLVLWSPFGYRFPTPEQQARLFQIHRERQVRKRTAALYALVGVTTIVCALVYCCALMHDIFWVDRDWSISSFLIPLIMLGQGASVVWIVVERHLVGVYGLAVSPTPPSSPQPRAAQQDGCLRYLLFLIPIATCCFLPWVDVLWGLSVLTAAWTATWFVVQALYRPLSAAKFVYILASTLCFSLALWLLPKRSTWPDEPTPPWFLGFVVAGVTAVGMLISKKHRRKQPSNDQPASDSDSGSTTGDHA